MNLFIAQSALRELIRCLSRESCEVCGREYSRAPCAYDVHTEVHEALTVAQALVDADAKKAAHVC